MRQFRYLPCLLPLLAAAVATCVHAQDPSQGYVGATLGQLVFISPSGQPFRAPVGQPFPEAAWIAQADTDKDGRISAAEFSADAGNFFDTLDINHDGYVSSPENTNYESNIAPEITHTDPRIAQPVDHYQAPDPDMDADPNGDKTRYIKQIIGASQYGLIDEPQPIRAADANFDFRISTDEWAAATTQRFSILDRNGDGYITPDELPKTPLQAYLEAPQDPKGQGKHKHHGWGG
ncbi:MAG: hypothetical protein WDN06_05150 [Asticcacaulis sp.]